jgi:hypothetical protein
MEKPVLLVPKEQLEQEQPVLLVPKEQPALLVLKEQQG